MWEVAVVGGEFNEKWLLMKVEFNGGSCCCWGEFNEKWLLVKGEFNGVGSGCCWDEFNEESGC